jgi:uncharacterized protein DUF3147
MGASVIAILAKTVCGGVLVLAFAALSEGLKPKRFAGILGAAPAVAIAGLAVGSAVKGPLQQESAARAMIAGAVALALCSAALVPASRRWGVLRTSLLAAAVWAVAAVALFPVVD